MTAEKLIQIAENEPKVYQAGKAEGIEQGIEQGMADVAHLNDELEQILYGTDTGGKSWLDTIYQNVTITQDCTNVKSLYDILKATVSDSEQLVMFINNKWTSYPTEDTPRNSILYFFIWSSSYLSPENSAALGVAGRYRDNSVLPIVAITRDYDAMVMAGDSFRKVVLR